MKNLLFISASIAFLLASSGMTSRKWEERPELFALEYVKEKYPEYSEEELREVPQKEPDVTVEVINQIGEITDKNVYLGFNYDEQNEFVKLIDTTSNLIYFGKSGFILEKMNEIRNPNVKERVVSRMFISNSLKSAQLSTRVYENGELIDAYQE